MSTVYALLEQLNALQIQLYEYDGKIRVNDPQSKLTDEFRQQIKTQRAEILEFLRNSAKTVTKSSIIQSQPLTTPPPLSFAQQRLWFLDQLAPNSAFYTMPAMIRLTGQLDVAALEQSFAYLMVRHASLRTTFDATGGNGNGEPVQIIHTPSIFTLPVITIANEAEAQQLGLLEATTPFNLQTGPLVRVKLLKLPCGCGEDMHPYTNGATHIAQHSAAQEHLLLLTMHHIICDAWSIGVLIEELIHAYSAYTQGAVPTLPALSLQYADFAIWQRDYLRGEILERQRTFWHTQLSGAPALLELPTDRPRPAKQSYRGAHYTFQLDARLTAKLNALAQRHDATLFMVLLAAFNVLLARYSRQTDIVVGTPIANRTRAEIEGMIGFFINTLALRTQLDDNPSFSALLKRVRQTTLAAYEHQDLPFEQVVEELTLERTLSHNPIFQVMLALQTAGINSFALPKLSATIQPAELPFARFDLSLNLVESDPGLAGIFEYSTDLFTEATIARMAGHFAVLLDGLVLQPDQPVLHLTLLTDAEYQQLVYAWNDTTVDFGAPQTIHTLFEAQVERTPDAVAIVSADDGLAQEGLTYAQLNARANQLAHYLIELGVNTETLVAVALERSPELVVSLFAILKAGGAYVPIDPSYPSERISHMLTDSAAPILLTHSQLSLQHVTGNLIAVDKIAAKLAAQSVENPQAQGSPEKLAYVIYTSGSTGQPKGVMIQHDQLYNLVRWHQRAFAVTAQTRASQMANPAFDATGWEIFPYLTQGATVVFTPEAERLSPEALINWFAAQAITIAFVPTPIANAILATEHQLTLHWLLTGGDKLNYYPPANATYTLVNNYGPTENTVVATAGIIKAALAPGAPTIGKAIDNVQVYILSEALQPVPINVPGELYIGGTQLARGYLNRPELTAERFIQHPTLGRLYKTGDLCRWLPDETIEFLGRTDFQVKIRGFRIELGEIEHALLAQPGVRAAVVLAREESAGMRLVAYLVGEADLETLRQGLAQRLPAYMVPAAFVTLDAMPLTPNGKLDRQALPAPDALAIEQAFVAPINALEQQVAEIWREVLGIERVGLHDDFFELGGHSLLATQVLSRVRAQLNLDVPLARLFDTSELGAFADAISQTQRKSTVQIQPVAQANQPLPLSFAQQRLWFLDQLEPNSAFYNIPTMLRLTGRLDVAILAQSFTYLIARHASLRTTFDRASDPAEAGAARQIIHAPVPFTLSVIAVDDIVEAQQLGRFEATTPFDLQTGPLLRVKLIKVAEQEAVQEHYLLLTAHHIISDGWSIGVLLAELTHVYAAYRQGGVPTLPDLPLQYADFAIWQRDYLTGEPLDRQLAFWRDQLVGAPPLLELPTDRPRPAKQSYRGTHHTFHLTADLTTKLEQLAQRHDATLFMVLLAAFNVLLARYSRQTDIVIGTPIANRNRAEIEGLIGFFINTLVLRTQLDDNPSFSTLLKRVRQTTLAAYEHQDLPFEQLVDALALERTLSYSPLYQVVLVLQNLAIEPFALPDLSGTIEPVDFPFAKFDLTLNLRPNEGGLLGILEYNTDLFDAASIVRMADHFAVLLDAIVAESPLGAEQPVLQLPMLTAAEYAQIVSTAKVTPAAFGQPQTIHQRFEQQAARTPEAVALSLDDAHLTYAQLNARANQLAHHLIALGVKPDSLVAVVMERSLDLVVSLLAILKAGGAYVPIDPTYPSERIAFTLQDCGAQLVVTQADLVDHLPTDGGQAVLVTDPRLATYPTSNPVTATTAQGLAYVIYTSGSTGQPKGALITHVNVWRLFAATDAWFGFNERDVWSLFHSFAFDFSVWEMWGALLYGGRLVIVPYAISRNPSAFYQLLCEQQVTVLNQTPSAFRQLISVSAQATQPHALRYVIFGGEALEFESLRPWFAQHGDTQPKLVNMYGITETTVHVTYQPITARDLDQQPGRSRIGQPIPDLQLYLLDDHAQPVPIGVAGELYVAGAGLARGYLNRPELTAARFILHPQLGRLYKTGDLGRWLSAPHDGLLNLEYLGRTDFQVKIRGFRIELGEIEQALLAQPGVRAAVAVVREEAGDKRIVAYFVGEAANDTLRQELAQQLPPYMVPAAIVELAVLPLTANGKLDRRALPAPDDASVARATVHVAPKTPLQTTIALVWAKALGIEQVGVYDNFFDLGGHSLLVIQICDELKVLLKRQIAVVDLFRHPTINELAHYLAQVEDNASSDQPEHADQLIVTVAQDRVNKQKDARTRRRQLVQQ